MAISITPAASEVARKTISRAPEVKAAGDRSVLLTRDAWQMARGFVEECKSDVRRLLAAVTKHEGDPTIVKNAQIFAKAHIEGRFLLPENFGRYTLEQWRGGVNVVKNHPACVSMYKEALSFDQRMQDKLQDVYDSIFGPGPTRLPAATLRVDEMIERICAVFSQSETVEPTVENMAKILLELKTSLDKIRQCIAMLENPKLFDANTDPAWLVGYLQPTPATRDFFKPQLILKTVLLQLHVRRAPAYAALQKEAADFDAHMRLLLKDRYNAVFGLGERRIPTAAKMIMGLADTISRRIEEDDGITSASELVTHVFSEFKKEVDFCRKEITRRLTILEDPRLLDSQTNPNWICGYLKSMDAAFMMEPILTGIHGWRLNGITIDQAMAQYQAKRLTELDARARKCLNEATIFLEDQMTFSVTALNAKLRAQFGDQYHIGKYCPGKDILCLDIKDSRSITSHHSKAGCTDGYRLMSYLIELNAYLRANPRGDDVWFKAEIAAGKKLDQIVSQLNDGESPKKPA